MKKLIISLLIINPCFVFAQFGIKAGLNFANVTKAASINNSSRTGFNVGLLLAPPSKKILSSRTELTFSRQGYNYKTSSNTGTVDLDYIMMPQYMCINITKYFQIQLGAQMAFLINAKADSSKSSTTGAPGSSSKILDLYNKFDYGYGGGIEIHPVAGLLIGARFNVSLSNLYKDAQNGQSPSFSSIDLKNNMLQVFAGWKFGKNESKKKKEKEQDSN